MIFRTLVLALSLSLLSLGVAFADDADSTSSTLPKEIQNLDPDRLANPSRPVNTVQLAQQAGITDSVTIWFKFKISSKGEASKIEVVHNPASEEVATAAQNIVGNMTFAVPSGRHKRKTHYYALTICPDCTYDEPEAVRHIAGPHIVATDPIWIAALDSLNLSGSGKPQDCSDSAIYVYPEMIYQAEATYPSEELRNGNQGETKVQCIVDPSGRVTLVRILKSSGHRAIDVSSVQAAYQCRFKPARCDDTTVPCVADFKYGFKLNR